MHIHVPNINGSGVFPGYERFFVLGYNWYHAYLFDVSRFCSWSIRAMSRAFCIYVLYTYVHFNMHFMYIYMHWVLIDATRVRHFRNCFSFIGRWVIHFIFNARNQGSFHSCFLQEMEVFPTHIWTLLQCGVLIAADGICYLEEEGIWLLWNKKVAQAQRQVRAFSLWKTSARSSSSPCRFQK